MRDIKLKTQALLLIGALTLVSSISIREKYSMHARSQEKASTQSTATKAIVTTVTKPMLKDATGGAHLAAACLKGLSKVANPPPFCWKKGGDGGSIPDCASGWYKSVALCYRSCDSGYYNVAGVCWNDYWRSYIPASRTMFDTEATTCPKNKYHQAALCYWDCEAIGMYNCGIGACSFDKDSCGEQIASIVSGVVQGAADAVSLVLSGGASAATKVGAKVLLSSSVKKMGKEVL